MSVPTSPAPTPAPATSFAEPARPRVWRVGTLFYTGSGLAALFAWLLWGDFAWNMKERAIVPVAQLMLRQLGASDFLVGLLIGSVPAAIGLILGPIISVRSDRHRGRWGRRIPYLLIPTPIIAFSLAGLAFTAPLGEMLHVALGTGSPGEAACRLMVFSFFFCSFEIFQVIAQSVFGGLINDVVPQEVIGRFFGLFRAVSLIAGMIFNFWLIGYAETHYFYIFLGLSVLYGVGFSLMCLKVKEGEYPPPPPPEPCNVLARSFATTRDYLRECFTNRYYLLVFLALMLGSLSGGPVNAFSVFYAKSIGLDMDAYGRLIGITFACSLALTWFLGALADRYHPLRLGILSMLIYGGIMLWAGVATDDTRTFSIALVAHGVIQGIYNTGTASIAQRLFPRLKFAQFASAAGIISAFGYMLMPPLLGKYLDLSGHIYRHTFLFSGALGLAAFAVLLMVWRGFRRHGGPDHYQAPE